MPTDIDKLEATQAELTEQISSADFYKQAQDVTQKVLDQLTEIETKLEQAYQRWDELEAMQD